MHVDYGFFAPKDAEAEKYGPALAAILIPVVYLSSSLLKNLDQRLKLQSIF